MTVKTLGDNVTVNTNDFIGTEDNVLWSGAPTSNFANSTSSGALPQILLRFTGWGGIPGGAVITDVKLKLVVPTGGGGPTAGNLTLRECFRAVSETTSSFNEYSAGNPWDTPGCLGDGTDRGAANLATFTYPGAFAIGPFESDSTPAFVAWAQAVLDSGTHPWLMLQIVGSEAYVLSAGADGSRPSLTVTYTSGMQSANGVAFTGTAVLTAAGIAGIPLMGQAIL